MSAGEVEAFDRAVMSMLGLKTYGDWRMAGRQVKAGEKARMFSSGLAGFALEQTKPIEVYRPTEDCDYDYHYDHFNEHNDYDYFNDIGSR